MQVIIEGEVACMYCPKCYRMNADENEFCEMCGHRLKAKPVLENATKNRKKCTGCGSDLAADAVFCSKCGTPVNGVPMNSNISVEKDTISVSLCALAFLIPLLGLILFCVYHNKTPRKAAAIGRWALIRVAINILGIFLLIHLHGINLI